MQEGVAKNAFTQEEADTKWEAWMKEKEAKVQEKKNRLAQESSEDAKKRLEAESVINKERAQALLAKREEAAAQLAAAAAEAAAKAEEAIAEIEGTAAPEDTAAAEAEEQAAE